MENKNCGNCVYNDDGLCDLLGRIINDDDEPKDICGEKWGEKICQDPK